MIEQRTDSFPCNDIPGLRQFFRLFSNYMTKDTNSQWLIAHKSLVSKKVKQLLIWFIMRTISRSQRNESEWIIMEGAKINDDVMHEQGY